MQNVKLELKALNSREAVFHVPVRLLLKNHATGAPVAFDQANFNVHLMNLDFTEKGSKLVRMLRHTEGLSFAAGEYSLHVTVPGAFDMREEHLGVFATIYQWLKDDVQLAVITSSEALIERRYVPQPERMDFEKLYDQAVDRLKAQRDHEVQLAMELLDRLMQFNRDNVTQLNRHGSNAPSLT